MPALNLFVDAVQVRNLPPDGNLILDPRVPRLDRVLLRRLSCVMRAPPVRGIFEAILDPGSPLSLFPYRIWHDTFHWQAGRDYDELSIAGIGKTLQGQVLNHTYTCRLARLRRTIELSGTNLKGDRLKLDTLVCQLADSGKTPYILLGLWGGAFDNSRLVINRKPGGDDLEAQLEF
jgi:hypothetical protein